MMLQERLKPKCTRILRNQLKELGDLRELDF